jgi:hypothetical protein
MSGRFLLSGRLLLRRGREVRLLSGSGICMRRRIGECVRRTVIAHVARRQASVCASTRNAHRFAMLPRCCRASLRCRFGAAPGSHRDTDTPLSLRRCIDPRRASEQGRQEARPMRSAMRAPHTCAAARCRPRCDEVMVATSGAGLR